MEYLANAEHAVLKKDDQVEELSRVHRREGVNMDYLKSIVVQYLAKPPGSSERTALLPVLATLLQFDADDYRAIEEGKQKVDWWGMVLPTYITSPNDEEQPTAEQQQAAPLLSSAEVEISATPSKNKTTSLTF
ncbi:hypothetical protein THAOC_23478 [Thalassiosira oceanica]|uniref:GRIP domain-containing protein n=1 Tax=Thalassiosira oceanica TaxID=159749 RepID=K0S6T5_THAOC|nr:hypothetical protein THAOC_23478 [Thalassiosira oceanica]|eukprot:EJK56601.1 hypothetical protein THAOC_23478 [Thalassiosira oceanica]